MYERILVPLDGSNAAEVALPYAEEIAARFGAAVILTTVSEFGAGMEHLYRSYLDRITEQVERQLKDFGATEEAKVHSQFLFGKPAGEILRYADETDVRLIVMASRGSSGQGPWLLGSIAAKVIRAANKPVLLVRAPASDASLQQKRLVKRILVPLDGSEVAEAAIPRIEALAQALSAKLVLFQVMQPVAIMPTEGYAPTARQEEERRKASAITYLDGIGKRLKEKGLSTSSAAVVGDPAGKIIDYAVENGIDLIAMSTHGRSGIGRWVFGSVTDRVLHDGDTPVLIVRAAK